MCQSTPQLGMGPYLIPGLDVEGEGGRVTHPRSGWWGRVPHPRSGQGGILHPRSGWGGGYAIRGLDGGVPHPRSGWWGFTPHPGLDGVPHWPGLDGVPSHDCNGYAPPPIRQSSIASTCYAVGGMPLAFTQEDFLVLHGSSHYLYFLTFTSLL